MATWHRCWRCKTRMPFLDVAEWAQIEPLLKAPVAAIQAYREQTGASLKDALKAVRTDVACRKFAEITGYEESNANALWHHRRDMYGDVCANCGELLRTPRARRCFECGAVASAAGTDVPTPR